MCFGVSVLFVVGRRSRVRGAASAEPVIVRVAKNVKLEVFQNDSSARQSDCRDQDQMVFVDCRKFMGKRCGRAIWRSGTSPG